ncbi:hypothetical protein TNCV_1825931 [Trichonephila clavipes]|nr:hypothetical protein TNCV_1825931 [Trichonephila clavipes]
MPAQTSSVKHRPRLKNSVEKCWNTYRTVQTFLPEIFYTFFPLKRALRFHSDEEMKEAMQDFLENQKRSFYSKGLEILSKQ